MKNPLLAATLLASLLHAGNAQASDTQGASPEREKCYGVAKAAKNDCAAKDASSSCAGQAKKDGDNNSWVFVPKGLCDKLAGGSKS